MNAYLLVSFAFALLILSTSALLKHHHARYKSLSLTMLGLDGSSPIAFDFKPNARSPEASFSYSLVNFQNGTFSLMSDNQPRFSHSEISPLSQFNITSISAKLFSAQGLTVSGLLQWVNPFLDDFEKGALGWSNPVTSECGSSGDHFLGGPCKFSNEEVSKIFATIPPHTHLRLKARFHFIDKWMGNIAYAKLDDKLIWSESHAHCKKMFAENCRGINICGDDAYADRLSTLIDVTIPHTADKIKVSFGSDLPHEPCLASWGVDDVMIWIR